ncbi:protein DEFECTIVE IN MERISTEM SILENCING 3-like isoform X2 [Senna tora]|uniref:Protein DEFECTIVE IN MERISTEM SILENCING 3-like isoform X2 n=1 Tax=Senna tora TaxID=362788 RepID=A0A834T6V3_9FABA|nr:protein DEFECTIVE IN MERISTEM SILENCING 3-like isoform X2 [Senna tora]
MQEREDDLRALGLKIKQHEDKLKLLKNKITKFDDNFDMIKNRQSSTSSAPKISEGESSHPNTEADIDEQILLHHANSAAGILCQMKTRHEAQAFKMPMLEDVVGVVATLANVQNDHLSTLLSEYLGVETMLAIVCKTNFGVGVLEIHNEDGSINKGFGLHGLGAAIGSALHDRFLVISLESLRPYPGKFVLDDPQRQLNILNPRLPNGQCPPGFLGFAVNMIKIDASNLFCVTPSGYGLRETLFYNLFSRLQVYRTRTEMMKALPLIIDGAVSLDGGIIRSDGVFYLGNR